MAEHAPGGSLRLAELVAALSLGVDLGFGQPMEHVLRQSRIALRLAELAGLDDEQRSVVYYTSLLVNVGCHSDAHEQAKWFGDDIAMKARKYDHPLRSVAGAAGMLHMVGRGQPLLHRFKVGLEFAVSGVRDLDGMIIRHSAAGALAGLRDRAAGGGAGGASGRPTSSGMGGAGPVRCRVPPSRWRRRLTQLAEFVEVAHRVGGVGAAVALARERAGGQFDPTLCALLERHADDVLGGLDRARTWDAVIAAEPALAVTVSGDELDAALRGVANFVDLKSPYTLGHAQAVAELASAAAAARGVERGGRHDACAAPVWCTTSAGWASRTRSGTSPARSARASGSGYGCTRT